MQNFKHNTICSRFYIGLSTKNETIKTTWNSFNITILRLNLLFCFKYSLFIAFKNIGKERSKIIVAENHECKLTDVRYKFRTAVSEVSFLVDNRPCIYSWGYTFSEFTWTFNQIFFHIINSLMKTLFFLRQI